ncbi:MAG: hypothetical protein Q4F39_08020 [Bacteroidia bacterium]|nr:hypothetical protein [Bacteroidia bacterium]
MNEILSINWYDLEDILVVALLCFALPISIVALVTSSRKRSEELKTQRYLAALEKGVKPEDYTAISGSKNDIRDEVKKEIKSQTKQSAKEQFQSGCIVGLIGLAFLIIGVTTGITEWVTIIPGSIMFAVGLGKVLTFFVGKKYKLDE